MLELDMYIYGIAWRKGSMAMLWVLGLLMKL
jgi:hypothetical protein